MNYYIIAPIGGFGNHVRTIALLSKQFKFYDKNWEPIFDLNEKLRMIRREIYSPIRTWHNWLIYEWRFRKMFDQEIIFSHDCPENINDSDKKFLLLKTDPHLAYKSYLKFNSSLNNVEKNWFIHTINLSNQSYDNLQNHKNICVLDTSILFQDLLDEDFYKSVISFFEIDSEYESANLVHQNWYNLHKKAEKKFVEDITKIYS
jgi:hypothetical protein